MNKFGSQDMVSKLKKVLMMKPRKFMSKVDKKKWNYDLDLNQKLIEKNYDNFLKILINLDIEIVYLYLNNTKDELCDAIFTHDPSLVINQGAIILNMNKELRKKETLYHINLYKKLNIPIIGQIDNEGRVEGGDCLWINKNTLLVGEGYRSNKNGIYQLSKILQIYNIDVIPIKLPKINSTSSCFHLMSLISMLDHDLAIVYKNFLTDDLYNILKKNNVKLLEIPADEYEKSKTLAVNILALSPRNLIMLNGYNKTEKLLSRSNCNLNIFDGEELCIKAEGGPTCLTRPILRI
ncbi:MAG: amidinotransferase [Pelagibacteraceae bacterium]|nr:amidinotransferase [Pelagibacteraceae bacterium]|tara:strand:+ start:1232 stop:2110 length:879 start_codon:yes stop_codon:yes gene_type:complete